MQWDKVKNVLIVILAAVNVFLLANLGIRIGQEQERKAALEDSVRTLAAEYGVTIADAFDLPADKSLPELSIDRSRPDEEAAAAAMLGDDAERTEQDDGTVVFESARGTVRWAADGRVEGSFQTGEAAPQDGNDALRLARRLLADWGIPIRDAQLDTDGLTATLRGSAAGLPVFNRTLTLRFDGAGGVSLDGRWSFGTPYTTVRGSGVMCSAADALLEFVSRRTAAAEIRSMEAGYRLETDSSRRLQLTPTWKIVTDFGEYLVDCDKKTVIDQEN